jgi:superfamily II DNA or RNA helicase
MLYRWQKECIEAWKENHYHGIVDVITGAGKTVIPSLELLRED